MKNELEKLIEAAKDYKEFQSIGNGAKLNCAIESAELYLQSNLTPVSENSGGGELPTDKEIEDAWSKMINASKSVGFVNGAKWMRGKIDNRQ